jgi:glycolate oxidase
MDWMFTSHDQATMQLVRRAFDPDSLANPGKIFPTPSSCGESLRRLVDLKCDRPLSPLASLEVV